MRRPRALGAGGHRAVPGGARSSAGQSSQARARGGAMAGMADWRPAAVAVGLLVRYLADDLHHVRPVCHAEGRLRHAGASADPGLGLHEEIHTGPGLWRRGRAAARLGRWASSAGCAG
ncbi:unnamed protein product, partial [Prorocentrum cordatum]